MEAEHFGLASAILTHSGHPAAKIWPGGSAHLRSADLELRTAVLMEGSPRSLAIAGSIAAIAGGSCWVIKAAAIMLTGVQPPVVLEAAPVLRLDGGGARPNSGTFRRPSSAVLGTGGRARVAEVADVAGVAEIAT